MGSNDGVRHEYCLVVIAKILAHLGFAHPSSTPFTGPQSDCERPRSGRPEGKHQLSFNIVQDRLRNVDLLGVPCHGR